MESTLEIRRLAMLMKMRQGSGEYPYTLVLGSEMTFTTDVVSKIAGRPERMQMYQVFKGLSHDERYAILADGWRNRPIPVAYRNLAQLIQEGYFDVIFTTNPGNDLEIALVDTGVSLTHFDVIVLGRDSEIDRRLNNRTPRVKIVKMRGDLHSRTLTYLLPEESWGLEQSFEAILRSFLDRDSIMVGLAPEDRDIERGVRNSEGSLWVVSSTKPPIGSFLYTALQARSAAQLVDGDIAEPDIFFSSLLQAVNEKDVTIKSDPKSDRRSTTLFLKKPWIGLRIQVANLTDLEFEIRADGPMGQPKDKGCLPYDTKGLVAVLKALRNEIYRPGDFSEAQNNLLKDLSLIHNSRFVSDMLPRIGRGLYRALSPREVGAAFKVALTQARTQRGVVGLQLRFDPDAVDLARYPWELLHDGNRPLLSSGAVELTRYITYSEAPTPLNASPPWSMLYITARPSNVEPLLPDDERQMIWHSLQTLTSDKGLTIDYLSPPTYEALLDTLGANEYHIIHFDGHGVFAKKCLACEAMNQSHLLRCAICQSSLEDVQPGGFLAFEDSKGRVDYVDTSALENALYGNQVRLAVISACLSATIRGETIFGGVGPGLIRAGIPAVVAMQLPIKVSSAVNFARGFYTSLIQGDSIPKAVAQGRRRLYRDRAYFIPTLYLRSSDDEGQLFVI